MNIIVLVKLVPDLIEELRIDANGTRLDTSFMRLIINEFDEHALEQGILLKEREGGTVTVIVPKVEGADDMLFAAATKGADHLIKLTGDFEDGANNHQLAKALQDVVKRLQPDLVLTGVQAHNDMDGALGPLIAALLGMPYVGYIAGISINGDQCVVQKEYPGGLIAEMKVKLPAVLGIQAAEKPPRYVAISKIRQAAKTSTIEDQTVVIEADGSQLTITRMFPAEVSEHATMIDGSEDEVADHLIAIFKEIGVL
jgi:electron transfer flavoprotein beta subunit